MNAPSLSLRLELQQTPRRYSVMPTGKIVFPWGVFDHWKERPCTSVFVKEDFASRHRDFVVAFRECRRLNRLNERQEAA